MIAGSGRIKILGPYRADEGTEAGREENKEKRSRDNREPKTQLVVAQSPDYKEGRQLEENVERSINEKCGDVRDGEVARSK